MVNTSSITGLDEKKSQNDSPVDIKERPNGQNPVFEKDTVSIKRTHSPINGFDAADDLEGQNGHITVAKDESAAAQAERIRKRTRRAHLDPDFDPNIRRANSLPTHPTRPPLTATGGFGPQPSLAKSFGQMLQPDKKIAQDPSWKESAVNTFKASWLNVLFIFVPISWASNYAGLSDTIVFVFSFLAIIPCASLLGFATEELALRMGQTLGGLLNATFGNAVELIVAILALVKNELRVVQASMLGSILSNCLLVLGMCFFAGGFRWHEQGYGVRAAQLNISLLSIAIFSIVIPAAFYSSLNIDREASMEEDNANNKSVLAISRGTSIILLFVYAAYLLFQLWTHAYIYSAEASAHHSAQTHAEGGPDGPSAPIGRRVFHMPHRSSASDGSSITSSSSSSSSSSSESTVEGEEVPKLKRSAAFVLLILITGITGLTAEFLVSSIDGLTTENNVSREFIALILLPLVGNAAEHFTAVTVSVKNKLDLAITVAVGSSIQIALFVLPFLVILAWIMGKPLSLFFDIFETVVVFVSILVVNYAISDGKTNWLEGLVLMTIWLLIALSAWFYPN